MVLGRDRRHAGSAQCVDPKTESCAESGALSYGECNTQGHSQAVGDNSQPASIGHALDRFRLEQSFMLRSLIGKAAGTMLRKPMARSISVVCSALSTPRLRAAQAT